MNEFKVNIDDLLNKNVLVLTINSVDYTIKDLDMKEFLECLSKLEDKKDLNAIDDFKKIVGLPDELKVGMRGYRAIVESIFDWQAKVAQLNRGEKATGNP